MRSFRAFACAIALFGLCGCISLFPKAPPAQLYRFGATAQPAPPATGPAAFYVLRASNAFARAAEGDRILTVSGDTAAYIAQARWAAPAEVLFDEAELQAFDRAGGPARLLRRGDSGSPVATLQLDVQAFEARYAGDAKSAPMIVVSVRALLVRASDHKVLGDQTFENRTPASDNRVGAIVEAFDAATNDVLGQIVAWTGRQGAPAA